VSFGTIRHTITHHHYTIEVIGAAAAAPKLDSFRWFDPAALARIPLSTTARKALVLAKIIKR